MKGVVIWGWSRCRSVMGWMRELSHHVPMRLALWHEGEGFARELQGHSVDEFADVPGVFVGDDWTKARTLFEETRGWVHLVSPYQMSPLSRRVAVEAKRRGDVVGVICEAPWNAQRGWRTCLWEIYLRTVLRLKVAACVRAADFFVCYSGEDYRGTALGIGWPREKIENFGYFSPPIVGSHCVRRGALGGRKVRVLATATKGRVGRGEEVIRRAVGLAGDGFELVMPDFVSMPELIGLYETCDVFVAAGANEPWGMRVNDALNCGMPFVVSDGMGARKLVDTTGAGLVFRRDDAADLARRLRKLVDGYVVFAEKAFAAADVISPKEGARQMLEIISRHT